MLSVGVLAHGQVIRATNDFILALGSPFRGLFQTMEQARAAAPPSRTFGYDNRQAAELYQQCLTPRWGDYALIYWLSRIIESGSELLDIGGNIGIAFYAFEKYLCYPPDFKWVVYDLPASVEAGKRFVKDRPREALEFTARLEDCPNPSILLASGALQYIDRPLSGMLASFASRPKHVLVNKLPVYEGPAFVTLQDIGPSICPYRVFNRAEFIATLTSSGYDLVDQWNIGDLRCRVRLHPSRSASYSGMYFKLSEQTASPRR